MPIDRKEEEKSLKFCHSALEGAKDGPCGAAIFHCKRGEIFLMIRGNSGVTYMISNGAMEMKAQTFRQLRGKESGFEIIFLLSIGMGDRLGSRRRYIEYSANREGGGRSRALGFPVDGGKGKRSESKVSGGGREGERRQFS